MRPHVARSKMFVVLPYSSTHIFDPFNFQSDVELRKRGIRLGNNCIVPSRSNTHLLVTSNDAIVPLMRLFQMSTGATDATDMTSKAVQWRYDRAAQFGNKLLRLKNLSRKFLLSSDLLWPIVLRASLYMIVVRVVYLILFVRLYSLIASNSALQEL